MTQKDETKNTPETTQPVETPKAPVNNGVKQVTSDVDIDFPSLDWGMHAGEIRELPTDKEAQQIILSNYHVTLIK